MRENMAKWERPRITLNLRRVAKSTEKHSKRKTSRENGAEKKIYTAPHAQRNVFFFSAHHCRILFMLIFSSFFRQRLATRKVQNGFLFFRKLHTYLNRLVYLIMEYYMAVSRQLKQQLSRKLAQKRTQLYLRHYQWFIQQMDMESSILMLKIRKW